MNITENEQKVLDLMSKNAEPWDASGITIKCRPEDMEPRTFAGVVGSLAKKHLIICYGDTVSSYGGFKTQQLFEFTEAGAEAANFDTSNVEMDLE